MSMTCNYTEALLHLPWFLQKVRTAVFFQGNRHENDTFDTLPLKAKKEIPHCCRERTNNFFYTVNRSHSEISGFGRRKLPPAKQPVFWPTPKYSPHCKFSQFLFCSLLSCCQCQHLLFGEKLLLITKLWMDFFLCACLQIAECWIQINILKYLII